MGLPCPTPDDWKQLIGVHMPAVAKERAWPVRFDHCFSRILLDNACGGVWYDKVPRPAYRHTDQKEVREAYALGLSVLRGSACLHTLNRASLYYRGKLPCQ